MAAESRVILIRSVDPNTAAGWLSGGKAVGAATTANASMFTSITGQVQQLANDTATLDKADAAAKNRGKDEVAARNVSWKAIKTSYRAFVSALQGLCDAAPDAAHALALAAAAGIRVRVANVFAKPPFYGKAIGNGCVHLYARLPRKAQGFYWEWQMSVDGKTWTPLAGTNHANYLAQNLTVGTTMQFRCRDTFRNVTSGWSQTIAVLVQ